MSQVEISNLSKVYTVGDEQITAVHDLSLTIEKGDLLAVVGHSGSGKTTLISMIGGILKPTSGTIVVDGTDICTLDDAGLSEYRNRKIGFMFQFASLLPVLTTMENVLLPRIFGQGKGSNSRRRAEEYMDILGLADKRHAFPAELSGGQQRRVAIARALINEPQLILADEPTGDLDEETEADILQLFHQLNREKGITFVIVTHSSEIAAECRKRCRMSHGVLEKEV